MTRHLTLVTCALFLSGCAGFADRQMKKSDVPSTVSKVREIVQDVREKDPVDKDGMAQNMVSVNEQDRVKDLFSSRASIDPTRFGHPKWVDESYAFNLKSASLRAFFQLVSELSGVQFHLGRDTEALIDLELQATSWMRAVEIVLSEYQLTSEVSEDGSFVRISTIEALTERTEMRKQILAQKSQEEEARRALGEKSTAIIRVYYSKADVMAKVLQDMLAGLSKGGGSGAGDTSRASFTVDARTNSIVVQASPLDVEWIKQTVSSIDKPSRQVLVEAYIVEGTDNFQQELGTRLGLYRNTTIDGQRIGATTSGVLGAGATTPGSMILGTGAAADIGTVVAPNNPAASTAVGGIGFLLASNTGALKLELMGMEKDGVSKIISNPRLYILDNEQASITDGVQIPYPVAGQGANQVTYEFKDAALKLDVKPSVIGDGNIYIEVVVNKDSPNYSTTPPAIDKREVKTKLLVRDGGVAMIGGINVSTVTSQDSEVPILGKIPGIGNLFKSTAQGNTKRQLYIFLAPSVI